MNRRTGQHTWANTTRHVPERLRRMCLHRDHHTCVRCGYVGERPYRDLVADEIHPQSQGGRPRLDNLQTLCHPCHHTKTQAEAQAGRHKAQRPRRHPADVLVGGHKGGAN